MNMTLDFIREYGMQLSGEVTAAIVITGLSVVFLGLLLLIGFVSVFGFIFTRKKKPKKVENLQKIEQSVKQSVNETVAPVIENGISDEEIAVIAAAIAAISEKSGKPLAIKSVTRSRNQRPVWASAGLNDNTRPF